MQNLRPRGAAGAAGRASVPTKQVSSYHLTSLVKGTFFLTDYKGIAMESPGNTDGTEPAPQKPLLTLTRVFQGYDLPLGGQ